MGRAFRDDERAVKWTLQAYLFVVVLLGAVVIAAGSVPTDDGGRTTGDHQRRQLASDVLSTADGAGALDRAMLYWNATAGRWTGTNGTYTTLDRSHPLGPVVHTGLEQRSLAYELTVEFRIDGDGDGDFDERATKRLATQGPPGGTAVSVDRSLVVTDGMVPTAGPDSADGDPCTIGEMSGSNTTGTPACRNGRFLAPDAAPASDRYNVLTVRVTVWSV